MSKTTPAPMHVMAGVLRDACGRVLLAQRPPGKHLAGLWEFPGGKCEAGEAPIAALVRELHEELGILAEPARPLIRIPWCYGERSLLLDAWCVEHWQGEPASLEGQALQWTLPWEVDLATLAPADRPILHALRLPSLYAMTPDAALDACTEWHGRLLAAIKTGGRMLQLRLPSWPREAVRELAAELLPAAHAANVCVLLNGDIDGARLLGCGVQLKRDQLMALSERPLPWNQLIGASCHDAFELTKASELADFAVLSPVAETPSHPGQAGLGWQAFAASVDQAALPVYALGGMRLDDMAAAHGAGGQGVAGISGFW